MVNVIKQCFVRCDGIAQCPGGEDFDGGEEDEGSFCDQFSGDGDLVE